ncbi:DNA polymerase III subunit gamma/tau [uncultured Desulfovibrio sp.]|uniref:DNA polymerase III subunit gamma/tau n=2 Tax=uncultured Desulfovibrio sp. TaxID=167968 RepID=UPI00262E6311|nr:DNA polymerase III subunit gamma/tau [uncultured Desulfovibrio sp.]
MKHLSLAARYRPQTFAEVAGQDTVKAVLSRAAAEDKVAAAYLLSGTRGVGKTTIARIFAKALNCEHAPGPEPCNQCSQCRKITQGSHVDVAEIDGASNNSVEDARALRETIGYAPMEGRYKVFIIDEAHMLSRNAFNALLKTLEEPPSRVVFIFATTEVHKFPITIVSRCQHFVFRHLGEDALHAHLCDVLDREGLSYEEAAVRLIARRAAGSVRDSMSLLDQALALGGDSLTADVTREVLGLAGQELFASLFEALAGRDCPTVAELSRRIAAQGVDIGFFVRELAGHLRTLFLLRQAGAAMLPHLGLTRDEAACWQALAPRFTAPHLHAAWQMTLDAQRGIVQNPEPAAALELLLLNLALLPQLLPLERLPETPADLPAPAPAAGTMPGRPAGQPPAPHTSCAPPVQTGRTEGGEPQRLAGPGAARAVRTDAAAPAAEEDAESEDPAPARRLPRPQEEAAPAPVVDVARPVPGMTPSGEKGTDGTERPETPPADRPETDGTTMPSAPLDWTAFCEYCRTEQAEGRPSPPPHLLRQMRAEWTPERLRLYPAAGQILTQAEKHRAAILTALADYGAGAPTLELVPPRPHRSEADLIEEFRQRPEMQDCLSLLNATIKHCTEV